MAASYRNLASNYFSKRVQNVLREVADDTSVPKLQELLLQAHALYEEIYVETKSVQAKRDLAASYHQLFRYGGQSDLWKEYVNRELELRFQLAEDTRTMEDVGALASCFHSMGKAFEKEGGLDQGLPYYIKEMSVREWFVKQTGTEQAKLDLASSYESMGHVWESKRNWKETVKYFERALEIRKELADDSEVFVFKKQLVKSYNALGNFYSFWLMDHQKARTYYQNALVVLEEMAQSDASDSIKAELIAGHRHLGQALVDLECWEEALSYYLKAYQLIEHCSDISDALNSSTVKTISNLYWKLGRLEEAIDFGKKLREIADEIVDKKKDGGTLDVLGGAHRHLYLLYREVGQHDKAKEHSRRAMEAYKLALEHYEKLYAAGREDTRTYIKQCCFFLGEIARKEGLFSQSKAYFEKALPICEQILSENRRPSLDSVYRDDIDFVKRQLQELEEEIQKTKFSFASIFNFLRR